jgi:hypothetical protein
MAKEMFPIAFRFNGNHVLQESNISCEKENLSCHVKLIIQHCQFVNARKAVISFCIIFLSACFIVILNINFIRKADLARQELLLQSELLWSLECLSFKCPGI